jgi:signal transduction histidine kinase
LCEICGLSVGDHIGRSVRETVPQVAEQIENIVRTILQTGNSIKGIEVNGQRADGGNADRVWTTNWYPLMGTDGSILGINVASDEITHRKRVEAALAASEARLVMANMLLERERDNKLLSVQAITASIAHEIRQPLGSISLNAETALHCIERTSPDHDEVRDALADIAQSVKDTTGMLEGLRKLFGKADHERAPVDLNQVIQSGLRLLSAQTKNQGVDVQLDLTADLPPVAGHGGQLQQVILNLVNNAIEAMDSAPDRRRKLTVKTELRSEPVIAVLVQDTGPGIAPEAIEQIFAPFVTTKAKGTGLGLAISRMIVEGHGGELTATSDGKSGASFQFVLPVRQTER